MSSPSTHAWLHPQRLEYVPLDEELAVVRLLAGLGRGQRPPANTALVAGAPHHVVRAPVLGSVTHRAPRRRRTADHLLWRVTFAVPLELLECPQAVFALAARDHMPTRLPGPHPSTLEALCRHWELGPRGASLINGLTWRRAAALGTAVAVAGSSVLPPAVALAAAGHGHRGPLAGRPAVHRAHHVLGGSAPASAAAPSAHAAASAPQNGAQNTKSVPSNLATPTPSPPHRSQAAQPRQAIQTRPSKHSNPARPSGSSGSVPAAAQPSGGASSPGPSSTPASPGSSGTSGRPTPPSTPGPTGTPAAPGSPGPSSTVTSPSSPSTPSAPHHRHHHSIGRGPGSNYPSALSTISPTAPATLLGNHQTPGARGSGQVDRRALHHGHPWAGAGHGSHHLRGHGSRPAVSGGGALSSLTPQPPAQLAHPASPPAEESFGSLTSPTGFAAANSFWTTGMGTSSAEVALLGHLSGLFAKGLQPPSFLIPIYKKAGRRYHIPWQVLAAINSIETNYGRDLRVSSAGAVGWMQFMPSTWKEYGLAANGHGTPNPYDPTDAIFSAAHYLAANGGAHHLRKAIFAYNHAIWYVDSVLWRAGIISDHTQGLHHLGGYALPLDGRYMHVFGRTDDGVDIEDAPDGAAVYSMTPGVVTAVASDPAGFGPNYPVIQVTKGPLTGQYIYYGHVAASLVKAGQHVVPGQPIAVMGHTGDAASLGHGHIEIGFSDSSGDPLNHHGPIAWTPSGAAMRRVLVALAAGFHIKVQP